MSGKDMVTFLEFRKYNLANKTDRGGKVYQDFQKNDILK